MKLEKAILFEIPIAISSKKSILEYIQKRLNNFEISSLHTNDSSCLIVTPNPEQMMLAKHSAEFEEILKKADIAVPDGVGIVLALRILGEKRNIQRITGVDLMSDVISMVQKKTVTIGLIGGIAGLADDALKCLQKTHPSLKGVVLDTPVVGVSDEKSRDESSSLIENVYDHLHIDGKDSKYYIRHIAKDIKKRNIGIVFLGLGAPKQEFFAYVLSQELEKLGHKAVLMVVGGAFDMIAGRVPRAPGYMRLAGLEWLWRLLVEPWRWRRQLALLRFVWNVLVLRVRSGR